MRMRPRALVSPAQPKDTNMVRTLCNIWLRVQRRRCRRRRYLGSIESLLPRLGDPKFGH